MTEILDPSYKPVVGWLVESPWLDPAAAQNYATINGNSSAYISTVMIISAISLVLPEKQGQADVEDRLPRSEFAASESLVRCFQNSSPGSSTSNLKHGALMLQRKSVVCCTKHLANDENTSGLFSFRTGAQLQNAYQWQASSQMCNVQVWMSTRRKVKANALADVSVIARASHRIQ